jgi:hypothetical protein
VWVPKTRSGPIRLGSSASSVDRTWSDRPRQFRNTLRLVEIHPSACKHGIADEDIRHAVDHALAIEDAGEGPDRWLIIGPDRAGNLLEVVVLVTAEDTQLAIHAMAMRAKYRRLIEP